MSSAVLKRNPDGTLFAEIHGEQFAGDVAGLLEFVKKHNHPPEWEFPFFAFTEEEQAAMKRWLQEREKASRKFRRPI